MADRIEELQETPFLTNSDAHSPWPHRLGREFNEINVKNISFPALARAIHDRKITANYGFDPRSVSYTHLDVYKRQCKECNKSHIKRSTFRAGKVEFIQQ